MTYFTILKGEIQMQIRVKVYLDSSEYFKKLIFDIDESRCKWMWNISDIVHCNFAVQIFASEFNIWLQLCYFENVFTKYFLAKIGDWYKFFYYHSPWLIHMEFVGLWSYLWIKHLIWIQFTWVASWLEDFLQSLSQGTNLHVA